MVFPASGRVQSTRRGAFVLLIAGAIVTAVLPPATGAADPPNPASDGANARPERPTTPGARRVARIMARMSLDEKVGQLFVQEFAGQDADNPDDQSAATNMAKYGVPSAADVVSRYNLGGVIYFSGNIANPLQVAALSDELQQTATSTGPRIPLLISTDQEGGVVTRIGKPASVSPGNMAVGATFDPANARLVARVMGSELQAMGVRLSYAPVVDVNTNPKNAADGVRSFGDRTKQVSKFVQKAVVGQRAFSVATSAKHFPGLGSAEVNTDEGTAVSNQTRKQFQTIDFPPFETAIAAGTDSVMLGHLVAPALDPSEVPASLSKPIVTDILRRQLDFDGMVITDTLDAKALVAWTPAQLALKAFLAGNDMLLMSTNLPQAIEAITDAVESGRISQKRLDKSVRRILQMKYNNQILQDPWSAGAAEVASRVGSSSRLAIMQEVSDESVTLLARSAPSAPLQPGMNILVVGYGNTAVPSVDSLLTARGATVQHIITGMNPSASAVADAVAAAPGRDAVVIMSYNAWANAGQQQLIAQMLATGTPVILGMIGGPYDAALAPDARAVVALYSGSLATSSQVTFVNVLFGQEPVGELPVTVPTLTDPQQTLFPYRTRLFWD